MHFLKTVQTSPTILSRAGPGNSSTNRRAGLTLSDTSGLGGPRSCPPVFLSPDQVRPALFSTRPVVSLLKEFRLYTDDDDIVLLVREPTKTTPQPGLPGPAHLSSDNDLQFCHRAPEPGSRPHTTLRPGSRQTETSLRRAGARATALLLRLAHGATESPAFGCALQTAGVCRRRLEVWLYAQRPHVAGVSTDDKVLEAKFPLLCTAPPGHWPSTLRTKRRTANLWSRRSAYLRQTSEHARRRR